MLITGLLMMKRIPERNTNVKTKLTNTFCLAIAVLIILTAAGTCSAGLLEARYCRIDHSEDWESISRTGLYADILVTMDDPAGKLVFSRGSSYLPYWQSTNGKWYFEEVLPRSGDGTDKMPDKINRYSQVFIIEDSPEKVVIKWRYAPDFDAVADKCFAEEYFIIYPDGTCVRKTRKPAKDLAVWNEPANTIVTKLSLSEQGIKKLSEKIYSDKGKSNNVGPAVADKRQRSKPTPIAAAFWEFDDQSGGNTAESVTSTACTISGHKMLDKAGIFGKALQFDGYTSAVTLPKDKAPSIKSTVAFDAWIAIGAYPWNWAPVVHQSQWKSKGYYFGIDQAGRLGLKVAIDGNWTELKCKKQMPLYKWTHAAAQYDGGDGKMSLYIDGEKIASKEVSKGSITAADTDLMIGLNNAKIQPTDAVRDHATLPSWYGFDGLIDEVRIFDKALDDETIAGFYSESRLYQQILDNPDMQKRILPGLPGKAPFGAYYKKLKYYETWDNLWRVGPHADVIVKFDDCPGTAVFWRGTSYGSAWVTENNKWISDQSVEEGGGGTLGCCEHMSDKQCRYAHVRIIESTDARAIVHYRYALCDILYRIPRTDKKTGWGDWVDEYFTIYPDAVGVRNAKYWTSDLGHYSFQDTQFLSQPGTRPEDNIEIDSLTLANQQGETVTLSWAKEVPDSTLKNANIELVNLKSEYKPFVIFEPGAEIEPWGNSEKNDYCPWPTWNHWPVGQVLSDGRLATVPDRLTHSALGEVDIDTLKHDMMMYGLTNKGVKSLVPLARSWNSSPELEVTGKGYTSKGYDQGQRAYLLEQDSPEASSLSFKLLGSDDTPIHHPCFVVKNWTGDGKVSLKLNGKTVKPGPDFRQGFEKSGMLKGKSLVVWLMTTAQTPTEITISR